MNIESLQTVGLYIAGAMAICFFLALFLFLIVVRKMRKINVPLGAGFSETLLYTPFLLVIFIDLLDFALDALAAPFTWIILDRLGLKALRGVFAFEALLPFTQFIPLMTLAWFGVRLFGTKFDLVNQYAMNSRVIDGR